MYRDMKKSYENENPSKVIITPKPPKGDPETPDTASTPKVVQSVIQDALKPGPGPASVPTPPKPGKTGPAPKK